MIDLGPDDSNQDAPQVSTQARNTKAQQQNIQINAQGKKINRYFPNLKPYYVKESDSDSTLIFESRFESGNLRRAV